MRNTVYALVAKSEGGSMIVSLHRTLEGAEFELRHCKHIEEILDCNLEVVEYVLND